MRILLDKIKQALPEGVFGVREKTSGEYITTEIIFNPEDANEIVLRRYGDVRFSIKNVNGEYVETEDIYNIRFVNESLERLLDEID